MVFPIKTAKEIELSRSPYSDGLNGTEERFWPCSDLKQRLQPRIDALESLIEMEKTQRGRSVFLSALISLKNEMLLMSKACDSEPPTYCKGCSFKCQASDCDCTCHDRMREYYAKKACDLEEKKQ